MFALIPESNPDLSECELRPFKSKNTDLKDYKKDYKLGSYINMICYKTVNE